MSEVPRYWRLREQFTGFRTTLEYEDNNCKIISGFGATLYKISNNGEPFRHISRLDLQKMQNPEKEGSPKNSHQPKVVYEAATVK